MDATRQKSSLGLLVIVIVGVVILYAALLTAMAFRDTADAVLPSPPPAVRDGAAAPAAAPKPGMVTPGQPRPPVAQPLRVSPTGPVGKASEEPLPGAGNLPGGGKALGN
jgi:hypothetical protein